MPETAPLIVFSHLRWDFVYQRPQHLLSRLAAHRPVFYIEEPIHSPTAAHWEYESAAPNLLVCRPHTPLAEPGFCAEQMPSLRLLVAELVAAHALTDAIAWLYTPLALPLVDSLAPRALVYDCMDELSLFLGAPPELVAYENQLLAAADVVFTGGQSLYRAKQGRNPHLFCFPSSVDAEHFRPRRPDSGDPLTDPDDQRALPHPRLGFYGVIDERMDLELLDGLARSHPEWQIVMIGPVVKIDPASLPQHPNIHYLGPRTYAQLPHYLSGWDVCLLPFARNQSTRFISPTKTLEYMAAERMIASTPITDVAGQYGDIVFLGDRVTGFVKACERALRVNPAERAARVRQMRAVLNRTSWQATASAMNFQLDQAYARRQQAQPALLAHSLPLPAPLSAPASSGLGLNLPG
jgi:UDP-galactopyranose mutase